MADEKSSVFQFLEQKYGYFHCKDCKTPMGERVCVVILGVTRSILNKLCRKCQKGFNPYRVEAIQCQ
ncbi:unnamed protein product, partial [Ranitomeya imitator]